MSPMKEIQKKQDRFSRLVDATGALVVGVDTQGRITLFNRRCEEVTGYSSEEVLGKNIVELFIPEDERSKLMVRFQDLVQGKTPAYSPEVHWITKSGEQRLVRWNNTFITDEAGEVAEIFGIGIDITDWKETQHALEESEAKYRSLFDSVPVGLYRTTPEGQIHDINPALVEMLGFESKEELLKHKASEFYVNAEVRKQFEAHIKKAEVVRGFEVQFQRRDGEIIWIELNTRAIRNTNGEIYCYEGSLEDITKRKEAEIKLSTAHQRSEFLVDLMAHDLNNINQGIMMTLELIESDEQLPKHLREGLEASLNQVERSAELITNVKRFQSLETEPRRLSTRDLSPPFHAAVRAVERAFPNKQIFLSTNIQDQTYWVYSDGFLTELFFNILHNAAKMDRNPMVKIEVQASEKSTNNFVKVEVQDQGPGVPDSEKKRIFNRYPNGPEGVRGSGIGLTLVQRILQRYGGEIWVEDRVTGDHTQGANFVVLLPRGEQE
ncbi:MAG: PAS domain S-box protein [Promethearchaeota archaeon]